MKYAVDFTFKSYEKVNILLNYEVNERIFLDENIVFTLTDLQTGEKQSYFAMPDSNNIFSDTEKENKKLKRELDDLKYLTDDSWIK